MKRLSKRQWSELALWLFMAWSTIQLCRDGYTIFNEGGWSEVGLFLGIALACLFVLCYTVFLPDYIHVKHQRIRKVHWRKTILIAAVILSIVFYYVQLGPVLSVAIMVVTYIMDSEHFKEERLVTNKPSLIEKERIDPTA